MIHPLKALQSATLEARSRTGDASIGTRVKSGQFQIVRVTYPPELKGGSIVKPAGAYASIHSIIRTLSAL